MSRLAIIGTVVFLAIYFFLSPAFARTPRIDVIEVDGVISPASAEYITKNLARASRAGAEALIIVMDTPGGLDLSMRTIIKEILNSDIPVVVFVGPSGARAASAGAIITLAAHVAAMAPGTNIGAAHPVAMGGGKMSKTMEEKVVNDAAAYVESIARKRGRNAKWAVDAVRKSVSITERQALKLKVIDMVVDDVNSLVERLDGFTVSLPKGPVKMNTKGAEINFVKMGFRDKVLAALGNPNVAYILMLLGMAGLYFELANPGAIFPGVVGGISLILAFFAFQTLPINYAGILLIILALILFIAEIKVVSHGLLTVGGLISLALGSIMLFESPLPYLRPSWSVFITTIAVVGGFFIFAITLALRAQVARPQTGSEGLVGEVGLVETTLSPTGKVFIHGEYWNAESTEPIAEGEKVRVVSLEKGMKVKVVREKPDKKS
ncbi:MAG: nodulation protein NfeD [Thermodesulfobacteriota bacterium]